MALEISAKRLFMGVQPAQVAVNEMNPNLRGGGGLRWGSFVTLTYDCVVE
jgi:hypothetical protein